jgi:hypothetical protein
MTVLRTLRAAMPLAMLAAGTAGCGTGITYNHDFDPSANLTGFRTYVWATPPENSRGVNQMLERRFIMAIDQQLQAKGYQLSTSGEADFAVNFTVTTSQQTDYNTYYSGMGYRGGWYGGGMGTSTTRATTYTNGTIIVDIFDVRSRNLIWRGTAAGTIEENASPEQRDMRMQEATAGILRPFPARQ